VTAPLSRRGFALQLAALPLAASAPAGGAVERRFALAFGTVVALTLADPDAARRAHAFARGFARMRAIEVRLGLGHPRSELVRLNRRGRLAAASAELRAVLDAALALAAASDGAFDPTVQPLWDVRGCGGPAAPDRLAAARALVDWRAVRRVGAGVRLDRPGMALTLNGIAQGFAADAVALEIRRAGVAAAVVDTGEFRVLGRPPWGGSWRLGIPDPRAPARVLATLAIDGGGVATSAAYPLRCRIEPGAHHVVDARDGRSRAALASVTVAAGSAMRADALATAILAGGPALGRRLLRAHRDAAAWVVSDDGTPRVRRLGAG
jgi:thiamine biosynthesis lipoprotein